MLELSVRIPPDLENDDDEYEARDSEFGHLMQYVGTRKRFHVMYDPAVKPVLEALLGPEFSRLRLNMDRPGTIGYEAVISLWRERCAPSPSRSSRSSPCSLSAFPMDPSMLASKQAGFARSTPTRSRGGLYLSRCGGGCIEKRTSTLSTVKDRLGTWCGWADRLATPSKAIRHQEAPGETALATSGNGGAEATDGLVNPDGPTIQALNGYLPCPRRRLPRTPLPEP